MREGVGHARRCGVLLYVNAVLAIVFQFLVDATLLFHVKLICQVAHLEGQSGSIEGLCTIKVLRSRVVRHTGNGVVCNAPGSHVLPYLIYGFLSACNPWRPDPVRASGKLFPLFFSFFFGCWYSPLFIKLNMRQYHSSFPQHGGSLLTLHSDTMDGKTSPKA
jgi:hypothetical protein